MKTISVAYKLKALHRIARQGQIWGEEMSRSNQEQRKILSFARHHGDAAACEAFEVSGRTLRRWRNLARTRGEAFLGDCRGGRSGRRSGRKADRRQVAFIRAFRADRLHMNAGKEALDAFSRECGLPPLSVSPIGRLIADAPDGMRASPRIDLDRRGRVKPRKRRRNHERRLPKRMNAQRPGDLVALDTVEIRPVGGGARLFLFTAVDHRSRLAFAMAFPKRNAQCAAEFLRRLLLVLPVPVLALLSDNGAEFQADFDRLADRLGLRRFFIFPSCPKQNGRNERFNRTLRHGFVQANEHFADDLPAFNRQLAAWLIWHNAQKPHRALAGNTPLNFLHSHPKNGQLLWTPTGLARPRLHLNGKIGKLSGFPRQHSARCVRKLARHHRGRKRQIRPAGRQRSRRTRLHPLQVFQQARIGKRQMIWNRMNRRLSGNVNRNHSRRQSRMVLEQVQNRVYRRQLVRLGGIVGEAHWSTFHISP